MFPRILVLLLLFGALPLQSALPLAPTGADSCCLAEEGEDASGCCCPAETGCHCIAISLVAPIHPGPNSDFLFFLPDGGEIRPLDTLGSSRSERPPSPPPRTLGSA